MVPYRYDLATSMVGVEGGIPTDGGSMELPLQKLEAQKASNPYKNPKDGGLKTVVARRRHIAEFIKRLIRHKRLVLVLNGLNIFCKSKVCATSFSDVLFLQ